MLAVDDPPAVGPGPRAPRSRRPSRPPADPRSDRAGSREAIIVVVVAVLVAVLLRAFVVQTFFIPSGSMEPTLQIGDRILVNKLSYHLHGVDRGDIVVFSRPPTENCGGPEVNDLVKRVIGLPGDVVSLSGGYVYVDGKRLDETWLPTSEQGVTVRGPGRQQLNLAQPVPGPGQRLLRHGRQPDRLVRQPLLGTDHQVADRRQGRAARLAALVARTSSEPPRRAGRRRGLSSSSVSAAHPGHRGHASGRRRGS